MFSQTTSTRKVLHCVVFMDKRMNHVHAQAVLLALLLMYFATHGHCKWDIGNQVIHMLLLICSLHVFIFLYQQLVHACIHGLSIIIFLLIWMCFSKRLYSRYFCVAANCLSINITKDFPLKIITFLLIWM